MNAGRFRLSAISAILVSTYANAMGLGEINLQSAIGEPLQAEIPILGASPGQIETTCFSLQSRPGADLPVVSAASTRLIRNSQGYRLQIVGHQPVSDPIFIVSVRAGCGVDLQRDYVMMPSPPRASPELPVTTAAPAPVAPPRSGMPQYFRSLHARNGDTLRSIAQARTRSDPSRQDRLLSAMQNLNPDFGADQPLAANTPVRIPNWKKPAKDESTSAAYPAGSPRPAPSRVHHAPPRAVKPPPPPRSKPEPVEHAAGGDRIVLGSAPDIANPYPTPASPAIPSAPTEATPESTEARIQRLESTLQQLNREVEKLNTALALSTQALTVQQKLIDAQSGRSPAIAAATPASPPAGHANRDNWLQLLVSALVGGGIAAGIAHLFGRRRRSLESELPLAVANHRSSSPSLAPRSSVFTRQRQATPIPQIDPASPAAPAAGDSLDVRDRELPESGAGDLELNENDSALELAEIMLSFGRIRGAAETLAAHIEENSPDNVQPWSMLLDLYRRADMPAEFESLAARMRAKFNIHIPGWSAPGTPVSGLKSLEDYAHILWRLARSWGSQDCLDYLYTLVHDNRAGQRSGFPLEVVEEIALLMRVLEDAYALKRPA